MPSDKSARVSERKSLRNKPVVASTRTLIKKAESLIEQGDIETSVEATKDALHHLDKAATKGVIHKNNAARRKSRLVAKLNKLQSQ